MSVFSESLPVKPPSRPLRLTSPPPPSDWHSGAAIRLALWRCSTYSITHDVDLRELDLRDGKSNGAPVWRISQAGMSGRNIVQIGISDFANSLAYAARAKDARIHVVARDTLRNDPQPVNFARWPSSPVPMHGCEGSISQKLTRQWTRLISGRSVLVPCLFSKRPAVSQLASGDR
jgi:hypothetical protein